MKELSSRILLKKRKNENRDFIIDEMIKMKKSKREFLEVSIKERECEFLEISTEEWECEFLEIRVLEEMRCEVLESENEKNEKEVFMMLIKLYNYWMNLFYRIKLIYEICWWCFNIFNCFLKQRSRKVWIDAQTDCRHCLMSELIRRSRDDLESNDSCRV